MARHINIGWMASRFAPLIADKGYVLLDGALATELERRGADLNDPLWSAKVLLEAPERIEAIHDDYFGAGADVATTASYQATFEGLAARGLDARETERVLRLSVAIAKRARDRHGGGLVAASVGCYGAFLHDGSEYRGDYGLTKSELMEFHRERFRALISAGPDLVAFETIPCRLEAEALVALLEEFPETSAWMSFSCRNGNEVSHGESFAECARIADASRQVVAVGVNCTPPQYVSALLESAAEATRKPFVVYPNSGEAWDAAANRWLASNESVSIPDHAVEWHQRGARILGGCCRTTPDTIREIHKRLGSARDR